MTKPFLDAVEINPETPAVASVIWMHGLGADGHDFSAMPRGLDLPGNQPVRYIFPHAPSIPVTINQGLVMPAWYDIKNFDRTGHDECGIRQSGEWIAELIAREVERGIAVEKIVLGGFSQGGAMALFVGLRYPEALAGIVSLSGYLLLKETLALQAAKANRSTSIFQAHGLYDPVVPIELGRSTLTVLLDEDYSVKWHEYPMQHEVCLEEISDIGHWLTEVLQFDRQV